MNSKIGPAVLAVLYFFSVLPFPGCASGKRQTAASPASVQDTFEQREIALGNQIHSQVLSNFYLYTEPRLLEYVSKIGGALAGHAERKKLKYEFTVLVSEKIFATSAPGGHVYITTGFLNFLDNEAQLAGVLGHEIGQLQYRDPRLTDSKKYMDALAAGGAFVGGMFGQIGALAILGLIGMDAITDEKSKEQRVVIADRLALEYMVAENYDPESWLDVLSKMTRLKDQNVAFIFDYYNLRPIFHRRFKQFQKNFGRLPLQDKTLVTRADGFVSATKGVREMYRAPA
ncbi:MAG: M48 family metalloprotease [Candidatus Omnitrophica bacterium]|nr:M48 family metalloprotease [Candidatus Omnitrophota bacterium]